MAKIPYEVDESMSFSSQGKMPWIEIDGEEIADSHIIILRLEERQRQERGEERGQERGEERGQERGEERGQEERQEEGQKKENERGQGMDGWLSPEQRAIQTALERTLEEQFYFAYCHILNGKEYQQCVKYFHLGFFEHLFGSYIAWQVKKALYGQGMGRRPDSEVEFLAEEDIKAVAVLLGDKLFMHGDQPSSFDAAVFGQLATMMALPFEIEMKKVLRRHQNLVDYLQRMKERYWQDWDELIAPVPKPSFLK